jgi:hypothetical protein
MVKQRDGLRLLDIPHQERRGTDNALEVLSIGGHLRPLPGWDVGHDLEGAPLYRRRQLSPLAECLSFDPTGPQRSTLPERLRPAREIRPQRVTGGKTPSEYIFSKLPQVADIARSVFHDLASPFVSQITAFWVQAISG